MSLSIRIGTERFDGIDQIRENLGDTGSIRRSVTPVLQQATRIGVEAARIHAPRGRTGRLAQSIDRDTISFRVRGDLVNARFGVPRVANPGRGNPWYPLYVHEGTGLFGRLNRVIVPRRAKKMVFPGGGKPWPVRFGNTGAVVKATVRGQKPQPYMRMAFEEASEYVQMHLDDMVDRLVG